MCRLFVCIQRGSGAHGGEVGRIERDKGGGEGERGGGGGEEEGRRRRGGGGSSIEMSRERSRLG